MTTPADAGRHTLDMKLGALEPYVPNEDFDSALGRLAEKARNRVAAERGFKNEVESLPDSPLQHLSPLLPCKGIGLS
jgi:hypothetical protein